MSFLGGGGKKTNTPIYTGIQLQTSTQAIPFTIAWGVNRFAANIIYYTDFAKHKQKQQGGKGGPKNKTYTYSATILMALCEGVISAIRTVWKDGDTEATFGSLGFSLFTGTVPQAPWGYLVSKHPTEAFSYPGVCYLAAANYDLGSSAAVPNHSFEVAARQVGTGYSNGNDADCAVIIDEFLTNPAFGLLFPASSLDYNQLYSGPDAETTGDAAFQTYCRVMGFGMSPVLATQEQASSIIQRWTQITNSTPVWTGYSLKFIPYCYEETTGNGAVFLPNTDPVYELTDDDFVSKGEDPVLVARADPTQNKNAVRFTISDNTNQYNELPVPWQDQSLIDKYGLLQDSDFAASELTDAAMASKCVALYGKRGAYQTNTYTVILGPAHCLIEPMDFITLNDPKLGLLKVQVTKVKESDDGDITCDCQPYSVAVSSVQATDIQPSTGHQINTGVPAGPVNPPMIFEPPANLSGGTAQVWCALSGGDGTTENVYWGGCNVYISTDGGVNYQAVGVQNTPARMGVTEADLPAYGGANPDTVNGARVDLTMSGGDLMSVSAGDASSAATLCRVGTEFFSFQTATLEAVSKYDLTSLWRGLYGTAANDHPTGTQFARLDENIFEFNLPKEYIGVALKLKFQSFNVWGNGVEDIASVTEYDYTPIGTGYSIAPPSSCTLSFSRHTQSDGTSLITGVVTVGASAGPFLDHYDVQYTSDAGVTWTDGPTISADADTTSFGPALAVTNYQARSRAVSSAVGGTPSGWVTSAVVSSGDLVGGPPDPPTSLTAVGGTLSNSMTWDAPVAGFPVTSYQVFAVNDHTDPFSSAVLVGSTTIPQFTHSGLGASDPWRYWVVAVNSAGSSTEDGPDDVTTSSTGGGSAIAVDSPSGTPIVAAANKLSFSGSGVSVTAGGAGEALIDIPGGTTGEAAWEVNAVGTGASQDVIIPDIDPSKQRVMVFVNGLRWQTTEYAIAGNVVTLTTNSAGDSIEIVGPLGEADGTAFVTDAVGTGVSQDVALPFTPLTTQSVMVFVNGLRWQTSEYTIAGNTLTLTTNSAGDSVEIVGPLGFVTISGGGGTGYGAYDAPPTKPLVADWTAKNFIGTTAATDGVAALIITDTTVYNQGMRALVQIPPAAPWDFYCRLEPGALSQSVNTIGICVSNSAENKIITLGQQGAGSVVVTKWVAWQGGFSGNAINFNANTTSFKWNRIQNDGASLNFYVSRNGYDWELVYTEALSAYIGSADLAGFWGISGDNKMFSQFQSASFTPPTGP